MQEAIQESLPANQTADIEMEQQSNAPVESGETNHSEPSAEELARERGWRPKEEWSGDPDDWANAKQFLKYGGLMDKVHSLKQKVEAQSKTLGNVEQLMQRREEMARQEVLNSLKQQRRQAIESGDIEAVESFDEKIQNIKQEIEPETKAPNPPAELKEWVEKQRGSWLNRDTLENAEMVDYSMKVANFVESRYADLPMAQQIEKIETEMRKKFPNRFGNPKRNRLAAVESETNSGTVKSGSRKYDASKITPEMNRMAEDFVRQKVFDSKEKYFEAYFGKYGE
jgi:hypothetical protein